MMCRACPLVTFMADKYGGHGFETNGLQFIEKTGNRHTGEVFRQLQPWARRFVTRVDDSGKPYSCITGTECLTILDMEG